MSNVLTNNTGTSIILTLNNVNSSEANVISVAPEESLLYNAIVIIDETNPNYNLPLIQSYIDSGLLLNQDITGITKSELQVLFSGNLTIKLDTGVPELKSNPVTPNIDNISLLPANTSSKTNYIYYKSIQGMSVSYDFGSTQVLINNDNLKYPDEITSFAIQVFDSKNGVLQEVNRLFIGTLREGVKTFTPGIDFTYVDFEPNASIGGSPIFKNSLTTNLITTDEFAVQYGENPIGLDEHRKNSNGIYYPVSPQVINEFTTYCATFVLALINNPTNSGSPIFIASRSMHVIITNTTIINSTTGIITPDLTPVISSTYETKVVFKYLHEKIYQNNILIDTIPTSNQPPDHDTFINNNHWVLLQENNSVQSWLDVIINQEFPAHLVDVITEYNEKGAIFIVKGVDTGSSNKLYHIECFENLLKLPIITEHVLPSELINVKIENLSYLLEIGTITNSYNIFITIRDIVWRYSSTLNTWTQFISKNNPTSYFSTNINTNGILDTSIHGTLNLKELSNFIVVPKNNTSDAYIGILSSEYGLILYNIKLANNEFTAGARSTRAPLQNVAKSIISDMKINRYGQNINIITCSYSSQIPREYYTGINCLRLINDNSDLVKDVYYLNSAIENNNSPYIVSTNSFKYNYMPSSNQLSYDPVRLNATRNISSLYSSKYIFKLTNIAQDTILVNALLADLASNYYHPYIIERIISSVSPAERNVLTLHEFNHFLNTDYFNGMHNETFQELNNFVDISNQTTVILSNTYAIKQLDINNLVYTSIVCVDYASCIVLPINDLFKDTKQIAPDIFVTTLVFNKPFSGRIYKNGPLTAPEPHTVLGLFKLIEHNMGCYPQVILNPSVLDRLNDIKYIDANRLEISFKTEVNTEINLLGTAYIPVPG